MKFAYCLAGGVFSLIVLFIAITYLAMTLIPDITSSAFTFKILMLNIAMQTTIALNVLLGNWRSNQLGREGNAQ
ncbi:hypothetical protein [Rhizobium bangladeshense]|uniref:hypothetical protein n=1 Tax=Rhizobium bangladeshense TaxID=1138189 RepID=UPI001C83B15F|nr:hypothetical protein [Rhizobium bangladeshense]MBX4898704.1 hypothetical protein [Rhizobium bangladeshense]MBY3616727.1 hypothetical protein [Rhizobium bangladeshense]